MHRKQIPANNAIEQYPVEFHVGNTRRNRQGEWANKLKTRAEHAFPGGICIRANQQKLGSSTSSFAVEEVNSRERRRRRWRRTKRKRRRRRRGWSSFWGGIVL